MEKRLYNTQEAMAYLGMKRKAFDLYMGPLLTGKGTRVGTSVLYERTDLDAAWESYKAAAHNKAIQAESYTPPAPRRRATKPPATTAAPSFETGAFKRAAERALARLKTTQT